MRGVTVGWLVRDARFAPVARGLLRPRDRQTHVVPGEGGSATLPFPLSGVFVDSPVKWLVIFTEISSYEVS